MKSSNGLFDMETAAKYAKALAKYGLDLDLDEKIDKVKYKYNENHSLKSNKEDEDVLDDDFGSKDEYLDLEENECGLEEEKSGAIKAQAERDFKLSELRMKNETQNISYDNVILDSKSLRDAVILKEVLDNPRIAKRRKRYSKSRSERI
ncbi:hypothetical protein [Clostridium frigidicarnis]|uniref:Uncharacterized protein n=1 Tax=Clostridium frigidicarnis TaxID=84698 RepID=A0A1I0ZHH5_9CLOT|nr:hypothetical protein [Clostridium frigidicarnis]SFB24857.1 hypothetical protein SAMN04488528_10216 [Clostridium frigidicarnis]